MRGGRSARHRPFATVDAGENGLACIALGASTQIGLGDLLVAGEGKAYDGPWTLADWNGHLRRGTVTERASRVDPLVRSRC